MVVRNIICLRMLLQMVSGDELGHIGHINAHKCTDDDDDDDKTPWRGERGAWMSRTSISLTTGVFGATAMMSIFVDVLGLRRSIDGGRVGQRLFGFKWMVLMLW